MATSDLTEILKKPDWKRDEESEKKLCELILQQLDDTSGDVSSLAVKWYVPAILLQKHLGANCQLDAKSNAQQILTVGMECSLGLLVRKVQANQSERILDFLCTHLVSGRKEHDRETASIALKTVVNEISGTDLANLVVKQVVPKLLSGMQSKVSAFVPYYHGSIRLPCGCCNNMCGIALYRSTLTWP
jgi:cullin-associated NEDD8-dissociated protein 1